MRWALAETFDVQVAGDRSTALEMLHGESEPIPVVVLDLGLPPDTDGASEGLAALSDILSFRPETKVIIASGNEDRRNAVRAVAAGAYDFYTKPVDIDVLSLIIDRATKLYLLEEENRGLNRAQATALSEIVTASPEMMQVCRSIEKIAATDVSVMFIGES